MKLSRTRLTKRLRANAVTYGATKALRQAIAAAQKATGKIAAD